MAFNFVQKPSKNRAFYHCFTAFSAIVLALYAGVTASRAAEVFLSSGGGIAFGVVVGLLIAVAGLAMAGAFKDEDHR